MFNINRKNLISFSFGLLAIFTFTLFLTPKITNADICTLWRESDIYEGYCDYNYGYNYNNESNNSNYNNNWNNNNGNNNINPVPAIFSTSPDSIKILTNTTITVSGNNFVRGSTIRLNNSNIPTTFINSQTLRGQVDVYSKGDYLISVFNPAPGGGFSNAISLKAISNIIAPIPNDTTNNTASTSVTNKTKTSTKNVITNEADNESKNESEVKDLAAGAIFGYNGFLPSSIFQWIFFAILILLAVILWRKLYVSDEEKHAPLKHA